MEDKPYKKVLKSEFKNALKGLLLFIGIYFLLWGLKQYLSIIGVLVVVNVLVLGYSIYKKYTFKQIVLNGVVLSSFLYGGYYFNGKGTWGIVLSFILFGAFGLWVKRKQILHGKRQMETAIWGKPLKDFNTYEEMPKLKLKLKGD